MQQHTVLRMIPALFFLALAAVAPARAAQDPNGPVGFWYLDANGVRATAVIEKGAKPGTFTGSIAEENEKPVERRDTLGRIRWDAANQKLEFRRHAKNSWQWFRCTIAEGVLAGRFSPTAASPDRPTGEKDYKFHVTGWNRSFFDAGLVPRVFDLLIDNESRATLRIDSPDSQSKKFQGRLKIYASVSGGAKDEQIEQDIEILQWDGKNVAFQRETPQGAQKFSGSVSGREISGAYTQSGTLGAKPWVGHRAEVLTYGFAGGRSAAALMAWQERVRRALDLLMMDGNPQPLARKVELVRADLAPMASTQIPQARDDDPAAWPQDYRVSELQFETTLPGEHGSAPITRKAHGYLAVPRAPPANGKKYPALLALNGHGGSAWKMLNPDDGYYWYGDSFARHGFIVLALDISHRPLEDRRAPNMDAPLYSNSLEGEDAAHENGVHPATREPGFDSDWEEDGERAWDAMRAIDYLFSRPDVEASRIVVAGLSMGGEITSFAAALDPRVAMAIPAGYSPDLGVVFYHGNHPCWRWLYGDVREYIDASDVFTLIAPRPLVIETGRNDPTYSNSPQPFAADLQVARRVRAAYGDDAGNFIHFLHDDAHHFRIGAVSVATDGETSVRVPVLLEPPLAGSTAWQTDGRTRAIAPNLYDEIARLLQRTRK